MKIRSFLAFDINDDIKKELSSLIQILEPKAKGMKWTKPDLMHCTMKFFGDVEEELLLGDISKAIEDVAQQQAKIRLKGVGIGVFPNWRYPRVIWAGLSGEIDEAILLHEKLETALESFGLKRDARVFRLHLTLGRAKSPLKNPDSLVALVEKLIGRAFGEIVIDCLNLYKSVLTKQGPVYTLLKQLNLKNS